MLCRLGEHSPEIGCGSDLRIRGLVADFTRHLERLPAGRKLTSSSAGPSATSLTARGCKISRKFRRDSATRLFRKAGFPPPPGIPTAGAGLLWSISARLRPVDRRRV